MAERDARYKVCFVSASGQDAITAELLDGLADALRKDGFAVTNTTDHFPPLDDDVVCLFAPGQYYPFVQPLAHPSHAQLERSVVLMFEAPSGSAYSAIVGVAHHAGSVLHVDSAGARALRRDGVAAERLPLGHLPLWDSWGGMERDRGIDAVTIAHHTDRRARYLAGCATALRHRCAALMLTEAPAPHFSPGSAVPTGASRWELMGRSNLFLHFHPQPEPEVDWLTILGAALNGCVLVTEHVPSIDPLVPGEHYISARAGDVPDVLELALADPAGLRRMRQAAYRALRDWAPIERTLGVLEAAIARTASRPVGGGGSGSSEPLPEPLSEPEPGWRVDPNDAAQPIRMALKQLVLRTGQLERAVVRAGRDRPLAEPAAELLGPELPDPTVSVLLTAYNYADLVGDALRSVALSGLRDVEVVVVDDASSDGSVEAIRAASESLPWLPMKLLRRKENGGLPAARNLALSHAAADLVFVLDADNEVLPRGLGLLRDALLTDPTASFAYGPIEKFTREGSVGVMGWAPWSPRKLRFGNYIDAMAMIRRSALLEIGGYPTDAELYGWEDFAIWVAMACDGRHGAWVPEFVARYRADGHSMVALADIDHSAAWAVLLRRYPGLPLLDDEEPGDRGPASSSGPQPAR